MTYSTSNGVAVRTVDEKEKKRNLTMRVDAGRAEDWDICVDNFSGFVFCVKCRVFFNCSVQTDLKVFVWYFS